MGFVIRRKEPDVRLFYSAQELHRPSRTGFYARLNRAVGSWEALGEPLRGAFHEGRDGRPVDPVVYLKIFLVGYLENLTFDTDLAERVEDSLSVREFVGYGPAERTPDHSTLSRVRAAMGRDGLLERVLENAVALLVRAGLVEGSEVAVDSTLLPANASLSSLKCVKTGCGVREHLARAEAAGETAKVSDEEFRGASDDHARIARKGAAFPRGMYHKATHVVDARSQAILASQTSPADVGDPEAALPALAQAKETLSRLGKAMSAATFDAGYDDAAFLAAVEEMGVVPTANYDAPRSPKPEGLAKKDFAYDAERDLYVCPHGALLRRDGVEEGRVRYRSRPADCASCPLRSACLEAGAKRRTVGRSPHEAARERNVARCHTDEGRAALKRRKAVAEPPFAHMKRFGGMRLTSCRGKARVRTKTLVAAIAWNLLKLAKTVDPKTFFGASLGRNRRFSLPSLLPGRILRPA